jgi:hypothetical protein
MNWTIGKVRLAIFDVDFLKRIAAGSKRRFLMKGFVALANEGRFFLDAPDLGGSGANLQVV